MLAPRNNAVTTQWRPTAHLKSLAAEWRALAERAAEPNVFYTPAFALPAARALAPDAGAVLVRGGEPHRLVGLFPRRAARFRPPAARAPGPAAVRGRGGEPHRLIGLFPCRIAAWRYGVRLPLL